VSKSLGFLPLSELPSDKKASPNKVLDFKLKTAHSPPVEERKKRRLPLQKILYCILKVSSPKHRVRRKRKACLNLE